MNADTDAQRVVLPAPRGGADARAWFTAYLVALAAVAFWPTPVDRGASGLLDAITRAVPWLTYDLIEVTANLLLFVPFGGLLALVVTPRGLVVPIAFAATLAIETLQALLLSERTPSVRDVVANTLGATLGLLLVLLVQRLRRARARRGESTSRRA
ncbi:VanZ family protein [Microbacterium sp. BWT-B31]|uniref:VanZ family protein n=1 Tax=Microbacterium sp. BWT-B31 TaxID=3232072 RepID=UPI003527E6CD